MTRRETLLSLMSGAAGRPVLSRRRRVRADPAPAREDDAGEPLGAGLGELM